MIDEKKTIPKIIADYAMVKCPHCMEDVNKYVKFDGGKHVSLNTRCPYCNGVIRT